MVFRLERGVQVVERLDNKARLQQGTLERSALPQGGLGEGGRYVRM
jgi:hypothetical protein